MGRGELTRERVVGGGYERHWWGAVGGCVNSKWWSKWRSRRWRGASTFWGNVYIVRGSHQIADDRVLPSTLMQQRRIVKIVYAATS